MYRYISIIAIASAGVAHLAITPHYFSYAFALGFFFLMLGVGQLLWAVFFWRSSSTTLYWAGLAGSGGTIVLWVLAQLISVPFTPEAQSISPFLVISKTAELIGFFALVAFIWEEQIVAYDHWPVVRLVAGALSVALVFGVGTWGGGHLAEAVAPGLGHKSLYKADLDHGDGHEADNNIQVDSAVVPMVEAPAPDQTSDFEAVIAAAVEAALTQQTGAAPTSDPNPDLEAVIAAAVAAAMAEQTEAATTSDPDSDLEATIAAAVAAALAEQPTHTPASGPTEDIDAPVDVASEPGDDNGYTEMPVVNREAATRVPTPASGSAGVPAQEPTPLVEATPVAPLITLPTTTPLPGSGPATMSMPASGEGSPLQPIKILVMGVIGILIVISSIGVIRNW